MHGRTGNMLALTLANNFYADPVNGRRRLLQFPAFNYSAEESAWKSSADLRVHMDKHGYTIISSPTPICCSTNKKADDGMFETG